MEIVSFQCTLLVTLWQLAMLYFHVCLQIVVSMTDISAQYISHYISWCQLHALLLVQPCTAQGCNAHILSLLPVGVVQAQ